MKPLVEALMDVARESNTRINVASRSTTRTKLTEGIIMETVIILEKMFKRGEISECVTASAINVDGLIPTPLGFIMYGRVF